MPWKLIGWSFCILLAAISKCISEMAGGEGHDLFLCFVLTNRGALWFNNWVITAAPVKTLTDFYLPVLLFIYLHNRITDATISAKDFKCYSVADWILC